jgi:hypothetical protein
MSTFFDIYSNYQEYDFTNSDSPQAQTSAAAKSNEENLSPPKLTKSLQQESPVSDVSIFSSKKGGAASSSSSNKNSPPPLPKVQERPKA